MHMQKGNKLCIKKKLVADIRCPLEYGLEIFGGKWDSRIICVLAEKEILRYSEIRKEMANIIDKVEYSLTDKGKSVVPILQSICKWLGIYHKEKNDNTLTQYQHCDNHN